MSGETEKEISGWTTDTLKEFFAQALQQADVRYEQRFKAQETAVSAALQSVREQTKASFDASEKAIVKAEDAQRSYNIAHNDLAKKMDEQNKATMPRIETESRFAAMEGKIADLKESIDKTTGHGKGVSDLYAWILAAAAIVWAVFSHFK